MTDLTQATVAELSSCFLLKEFLSEEVTKAYLQKSKLQKNLMLILTSALKSVLPQAREADKENRRRRSRSFSRRPYCPQRYFRNQRMGKHSCQQDAGGAT